ncbi:helix-turn-helix domain-containing protein [Klebsiella aerogenes]|uniref:helix-turn-helix domain-containing protein n=1 Tax=Klebsiella aerogenes TaxID=548 RepID=UPI003878316C
MGSVFEAFVKVMETGSISVAADQLFITQPAVTKEDSQPGGVLRREAVRERPRVSD